ncbi:glucose dehydrogenase [Geomonas silvestris]|uniref:Glucose dehydrogenase n=1 Tax=Geomonas silvestris TaxID=2740184 RepID=A0A6V8MN90_9BACT|nr:PQQ-dependent sugar dehydrogenase [Geomonas silvestris]GFO61404.1 glucose dehydrogenase [Geomonas silvestris]
MKPALSVKRVAVGILLLVSLLSACESPNVGSSAAAKGTETLTLTKVASGFKHPTTITNAADGSGRLFIVEQGGRIRILHDGQVLPKPFLDISHLVTRDGGEQGLLGLAFPPDYAHRKQIYVDYTNKEGIGNTVIARISLASGDANRADPRSLTRLLTIKQPYANHNGGEIVFGPDKMLYIGMGDGGSAGDPKRNGQNARSLLGKLLRIDVLGATEPYAVPAGNPFGNEVWAYGLRNPWRFSFDRGTGDLYIADVGQDLVEEIDYQPDGKGAGANYGWSIMEGSRCFRQPGCKEEGLTMPVAEYRHGEGDCSVTGGYVYRGKHRALQGIYFYGDFCSGRIWGLKREEGNWKTWLVKESGLAISTFGEDESGELYVADYGKGDIYRVGAP